MTKLNLWYAHLLALREREEGQTMAEYGVVLAVITIGAIAAFTVLSDQIETAINAVARLLRVPS